MGDLTEMVRFEGLDGTKRMLRWDMNAGGMIEAAFRKDGREASERNVLKGITLDLFDATATYTTLWAMLASADEWMDLKGGARLTRKRTSQLMGDHNVQACLEAIAECRVMNEPPPAEKAPGKKRARGKAKKRAART